MNKYLHYLIYIITLATLALSVIAVFWPKFFYINYLALALLLLAAIIEIIRHGTVKDDWRNFAAFPLLFLVSTAGFIVLISNKPVIFIIIGITALFYFKYYQYVYYYFHQPSQYQTASIENISTYGNFLAFFFMASALFGFQSFLDAPAWLTTSLLAVFTLVMLAQNMWACKINEPIKYPVIAVTSLVMLEISWAVSLLPIRYYVAGMTLTFCFYIIFGLLKYQLRNSLDKSIIKVYTAISLAGILLILLTAQWM
jgi:hypothetical protein